MLRVAAVETVLLTDEERLEVKINKSTSRKWKVLAAWPEITFAIDSTGAARAACDGDSSEAKAARGLYMPTYVTIPITATATARTLAF